LINNHLAEFLKHLDEIVRSHGVEAAYYGHASVGCIHVRPILEGAFAAADIVDPATGEVVLEANEEVTPRVISMAQEKTSTAWRCSSLSATRWARSSRRH
jgi:FAD/FMN-containing dehydrogenase